MQPKCHPLTKQKRSGRQSCFGSVHPRCFAENQSPFRMFERGRRYRPILCAPSGLDLPGQGKRRSEERLLIVRLPFFFGTEPAAKINLVSNRSTTAEDVGKCRLVKPTTLTREQLHRCRACILILSLKQTISPAAFTRSTAASSHQCSHYATLPTCALHHPKLHLFSPFDL